MREYLINLINNFELKEYETLSEISVIGAIARLNNYKILVWGGGPRGRVAIKFIKTQNVKVDYVIDIDKSKRGMILEGAEIIHPDDMPLMLDKNTKYYVIIATDYYLFPYDQNYIIRKCAENNIFEFLDIFKKEYCGNHMLPYNVNVIEYYINHVDEALEVLDMLEDEESKKNFCEFIRVKLCGDVWRLEEHGFREKYWGGAGLFQLMENEAYVNCGSSVGDSIFHFIDKVNGKFERIDAYEADPNIVKRFKSLLHYIPDDMREKITIFSQFLGNENDRFSLDTMYQDKRVTLIDMDIEGAEYNVVRGAQKLLSEQQPVLAICVYHKVSDIIEIPKLVKKYASNYHIFMRKYVTTAWNQGTSSELVMYGIPNDRLEINDTRTMYVK